MKYIELTIRTTSEASELVADILWNDTEGGVAVSDSADVIALQSGKSGVFWDYLDEDLQNMRKETLVKAFLRPEKEREIPRIMREIYACRDRAAGEIDFGTLEESKRVIDGDDWIEIWKKHFRPLHIGPRVVVVPAWIAYEPKPHETVVTLDSNMAFGTGEHETTSMCLELLQEYLQKDSAVLDVGCGSGILGIAAAKLGAAQCFLTDIDPIAVESAAHNAEKNGVEDRVVAVKSNLIDDASMNADLILANITAEILVSLAPAAAAHLNEGGTVILSGIISDRVERVREAFRAAGLQTVREIAKGEWYALVLKEAKNVRA